MINTICLDNKYSTTQLLTKEKPIWEDKPEYKLETKLFLAENSDSKKEGGLRTKGYFKKSYENKPLISVITVVFNGEKHLEQTIQSVLSQNYDNVEYIIIDGGSTDKTLDIINKYESGIDYWISEQDKGIFHAMNKGLQCASGEFISFINSDDCYKDNVFEKIVDNILNYPNVDFFYGDVDVVTREQSYLHIKSGKARGALLGMNIPHQSCFIRLGTHKKYPFDISYKIGADRVIIAELFKHNYKDHYMGFSVANFMEGGASADPDLTIKELNRYWLQYFGVFFVIKETLKRFLYRLLVRTKLNKALFSNRKAYEKEKLS